MESNLQEVREFIRENFTKIDSINKSRSSYGIKHYVEREIGKYVSNHMLIEAMIAERYDIRRVSPLSPNFYFNVSSRSFKKTV